MRKRRAAEPLHKPQVPLLQSRGMRVTGASSPRRTRHIAILAVVAVALMLVACSATAPDTKTSSASPSAKLTITPTADLSKQSIVVSNWPNYMAPDTGTAFTKETKAKISIVEHASNQEVVEKIANGGKPTLDVAFVSGQYAQQLNAAGLLEPIDPKLIPNLAKLSPEAGQLAYDPGNTFSVPYSWGTTGICYREDLVGTAPTSWKDVLTPSGKNTKAVLMLSTQPWLNLPAAKSLGFSVNTTDAGQLKLIQAQLLKTKPLLLGYDDTTFIDRLDSGAAHMAVSWDGWCNYATNKQVKFVLPKEGSALQADTMVVLKSSKDKDAAMAFINFMIDNPAQTWMTDNILYKSPNKAVAEAAAKSLGKDFPNMAIPAAELAAQEAFVDIGAASTTYAQIAKTVTGQ